MGDVIEVVGHMTNYHPNYNMYAASIVLNNELLWITGGLVQKLETNSIVLETTEYLDIANNDGKSYPGPNLPTPVYVIPSFNTIKRGFFSFLMQDWVSILSLIDHQVLYCLGSLLTSGE